MANKPNYSNSAPGTQFFDQMTEFMEDLSTIRALAEKLAAKMEEMSQTGPKSDKQDA